MIIKNLIQSVAAAGVLLVAAGCLVGPDYRRPQESVPATWTESGIRAAPGVVSVPVSRPAGLTNWWTSFGDRTMESLIERALAANLDLKQAASRLRQARERAVVAGSAGWPTADLVSDYSRNQERGKGVKAFNVFRVGVDAAWELDVFGGVRRGIEAAEAEVVASQEDLSGLRVTLAAEVALNYLELRGLQRERAIARENLAVQRRAVELTRQLYEGGFRGRLDLANAEAQVAVTESQLPVYESLAWQRMYALSLLLGLEPGALTAELVEEAPIPVTPPEVPVGLPSDLLRRRPDIRRAEARLHAATARIGVATADLFPKFSLTGAFGWSPASLHTLVRWDNRMYTVGPTVAWNVFDAGRLRAQVRVQGEAEEQALLDYQKAVLTALTDVESALVAYVQEQRHRHALLAAAAGNRLAVSLATQLYKEGQTDFLSVLDAQRSLFAAEDGLAQSERTVAMDLVALYKALGGGWALPAQSGPVDGVEDAGLRSDPKRVK